MKLILHHLLKDIRAQRWLLLLWALVLVIPLILNALIFQPDYDTAKYINSLRVSPLLMFLNVIVWTIIVARLVQCEPVTGSTSFWLTRPVPKWVYLVSKLLFLSCLVTLPAALASVVSLAQLQATPEMVRSTLTVLVIAQAAGGLCVIWLATYTPSLLHFAGTLCVGLLALVLFTLLSVSLHHPRVMGSGLTVDYLVDILVPGLFLSLVIQHWHRRGRAGLVVGLAAIVVALIAQVCLPVALPPTSSPVNSVGQVARLDVSPDWQKRIFWGRRETSSEFMTVLKPVDDKDAGFVIQSTTGEFQVPGENPAPLALESEIPQMWAFQRNLKPLAMTRNELPGFTITRGNNGQDGDSTVTLFSLDPTQKAHLQGKTGMLALKAQGQKLSLFQMAKIPLNQPHFIAHVPGGFIRLKPSTSPADLSLVVWSVSAQGNISWAQEMIYVLVDPQNHTGTLLDASGASSSSNSIGGSFRIVDSETSLGVNRNEPLDQMDLYIYEARPGTPFEIALTDPNFTMDPK